MIRTVHPFPARMAPELALTKLSGLQAGSTVLDPMAGSGTVLRQASDLGHQAVGFDMDPLAVLMTRVWTSPVDLDSVRTLLAEVLESASRAAPDKVVLPWIDHDPETAKFIDYWFGDKQKQDLRRIAHAFTSVEDNDAALDILKVALSRIIVTKEQCASLARDTSHSRPHKVVETSEYEVMPAFERSVKAVLTRLEASPPSRGAEVALGDARNMNTVADSSVDAVLTSPPYLNAIDYLRGHRMSLVWLGHRFADLRTVRSDSIGSERSPAAGYDPAPLLAVKQSMGDIHLLPARFDRMIDRYVRDIYDVMTEVKRVLRDGGTATFVVGNSCLRSIFIQNSEAVATAAAMAGLTEIERFTRDLPTRSRYLPMSAGSLAKRMRTETILSFN